MHGLGQTLLSRRANCSKLCQDGAGGGALQGGSLQGVQQPGCVHVVPASDWSALPLASAAEAATEALLAGMQKMLNMERKMDCVTSRLEPPIIPVGATAADACMQLRTMHRLIQPAAPLGGRCRHACRVLHLGGPGPAGQVPQTAARLGC